jgi:hypothetical protein
VGVPWLTVGRDLVVPHIQLSGDYLAIVVAIFGLPSARIEAEISEETDAS